MNKRKKGVPEETGQVIGKGIFEIMDKSNMTQYHITTEELHDAIDSSFGKSRSPSDFHHGLKNDLKFKEAFEESIREAAFSAGWKLYDDDQDQEMIERRKAPWECNKK